MSAWVPTTRASWPAASPSRISRRARLPCRPAGGAGEGRGRRGVVKRRVVLAGEDLGGRHDGGPAAGAMRHQRRQGGHHRLAAADVALEQPVQRPRVGEVGEDLVGGDALAVGEAEGKALGQGPRHLGVIGGDEPRRAQPTPPRPLRGELEQEELLEGHALPAGVGRRLVVGDVHLPQRLAHRHQPLRLADGRRQPVGDPVRHRQVPGDQASEEGGGELLSLGVHRRQASDMALRGPGALERRALEGEAMERPLELPAHQKVDADLQLGAQVGVVEPDGADLGTVLLQRRLDKRHASPGTAPDPHAGHPDPGCLDHPRGQMPDRRDIPRILIAARQMQQKIGKSDDAQPGEAPGPGGSDPGQPLHRRLRGQGGGWMSIRPISWSRASVMRRGPPDRNRSVMSQNSIASFSILGWPTMDGTCLLRTLQ